VSRKRKEKDAPASEKQNGSGYFGSETRLFFLSLNSLGFFYCFFFPYHLSIRVSRVENLRNNFPHHDLAENKKLASRKSVHLIMAQRWKMINIFAAAAQPHFPRPAGSTRPASRPPGRPPSATFSNAVFFH